MNFEEDKQKTKRLSELLSAVEKNTAKPDKEFLNKLQEKSTTEFIASSTNYTQNPKTNFPIWSNIMKSKITKFAAAAAIIIVVSLIFSQLGSPNLAWADVVRPILTARTVIFNLDMGAGKNAPICTAMNMGTQRLRTEVLSADNGTLQQIVIVDYDTSQMLTLIPGQKTAVLIEMKDLTEEPENVLEEIRNIITDLQNNPDVSIESLGEQEINGRNAIVFHATGPDEEFTIWADPQTALPIRVEQKWHQMQFTCTDFQFDIEMDESLFSMEIPEGYSAAPTSELSFTGSTEQDLTEALRIYAEAILDGVFPQEFIGEEYINDVMKNREKWSKFSQEQKLELGLKLGQGYIFTQVLKDENDWNYVGGGVKLGDAESPVCWYRPDGSQTYRVIYGDLSVKDVAPEDLPE